MNDNHTTISTTAAPFKLLETDNISGIPAGWLDLVRAAQDGKTYDQIATANTLAVGTVKSRIHRTRSRILAQRAIAAKSRARLLLKDVKLGDRLRADGGFTCIEANRVCDVKRDDDGDLYVDCCGHNIDLRTEKYAPLKLTYSGRHGLDGQEDEGGVLIGFEKVEA